MQTRPRILGALLREAGAVTQSDLERALEEQRVSGERLGVVLTRSGRVEPDAVARSLARQLGLPFAEAPLRPAGDAVEAVPGDLARARRILPLSLEGRRLRVAMADPLDRESVDDLRFITGRHVETAVATPAAVDEALANAYGDGMEELLAALPSSEGDAEGASRELAEAIRAAPVVRVVDRLLHDAVDQGASDIHVEETGGRDVRVRYRIDGVLRRTADLPAAARHAILSRIKVVAGMDISVRRRPQDGRIVLDHQGTELTLRVSTLPVNGGEKAVVRILDPDAVPRSLDTLGLAPASLTRLRALLSAREGVVLATGPTGSGKSSTLFAALSEVDRVRGNVVTLEDPVEYRLEGANQVQVDRRAGLGFAEALRAVLRQDPDVVMVGEIRDRETAEIAMAAAVTGHLVLSTLHTNDAPGAVSRLLDMGVPPFLVAGGLTGVVGQRLVRRLCRRCRGGGCRACHEGFRGRTGVFQVLVVSDPIRDRITRGLPTAELRRLAREAGMGTLADDARRVVAEGLTTPHEIGRVLHADPGAALPCPGCGTAVPIGAAGCPGCGARRVRRCRCGRELQRSWRYCPDCIRKVP